MKDYFFFQGKGVLFFSSLSKVLFLVVTLTKFQSVRGASYHLTFMGKYLFLCLNFPVNGFMLFHFCCLPINVEISYK